jgi:two-component system response regulator AtoC
LSIIRKNKIDIVLLDIRLKGKRDGIDLLKELKLAEPEIIILMLTGYGSIDSSVQAMKEGASDYILKPADNTKLLDAVNKQFEIKNLRNENSYLKKTLRDSIFTYDFRTDNFEVKKIINIGF